MQITVEGIPIAIEWHKFVVGTSFYVPCLDRAALAQQVEHAAKVRGMRIKARFTFEQGTQGVRFWRTK